MIPLKPFYMIRHGESEANLQGIYSGQMDTPLTQKGRDQAAAAEKILTALGNLPDIVIHSDLSRARDTAHILNQNLGLEMIEIADLGEHHFGAWQGQNAHERNPIWDGVNPPDGETIIDFNARVARGFTTALSHSAQRPLIVCHGGIFRGFCANYDAVLHGVKNCELYAFTPRAEQSFPWLIHRHHDDGTEEIALKT